MTPAENQARGEAPTVAKLQQTVEAALNAGVSGDRFYDYTSARAALRDLVAQADRAAELEAALRRIDRNSSSQQVHEMVLEALAGDGGGA